VAAAGLLQCSGSAERQDSALRAELDVAPFSRFEERFLDGAQSSGGLRIVPLEELPTRQPAIELMRQNNLAAQELKENLLQSGKDAEGEFTEALALAMSEVDWLSAGGQPTGEYREQALALLDEEGAELLAQALDYKLASTDAVISQRNAVFARRVAECFRVLQRDLDPGSFRIMVFTGAAHVTGVVQQLSEALPDLAPSASVDLGSVFREALSRIDSQQDASVSAQLAERLNERIPDVDLGPILVRGDSHSPFFDPAKYFERDELVSMAALAAVDYPVSIARYNSLVDEVRQLVLDGKFVVFFAELEATTLVESLADLRRERRFDTFVEGLAEQRDDNTHLQGDSAWEQALRLFPFFHVGPPGMLFVMLDEATLAPPFLRALEK
jgi:hypothetical protein